MLILFGHPRLEEVEIPARVLGALKEGVLEFFQARLELRHGVGVTGLNDRQLLAKVLDIFVSGEDKNLTHKAIRGLREHAHAMYIDVEDWIIADRPVWHGSVPRRRRGAKD